MQILAGLVVGVMLAGGTYAIVKVYQIQQAEKTADADAGLAARQPDGAEDPATGGTGTGTSSQSPGAPAGNSAGNPAGAGSLEVPNLVGISAQTAINELRQRGLKEVKLTSDAGEGIDLSKSAEWTVIKQSEKPGAKVGASTVITLTCMRGY